MNKRTWKWAALLASGATVLQVASCASMLFDSLLQQILVTIVSGVVSAATGAL